MNWLKPRRETEGNCCKREGQQKDVVKGRNSQEG